MTADSLTEVEVGMAGIVNRFNWLCTVVLNQVFGFLSGGCMWKRVLKPDEAIVCIFAWPQRHEEGPSHPTSIA